MSHDEIIEQAARVICAVDYGDPDNLIGEYDEFGRFTTSEVAWTEYVAQACALAEAGLLARPLPTRDEIAMAIADGWNSVTTLNATAQSIGPTAAADAVLDLLKGQDA